MSTQESLSLPNDLESERALLGALLLDDEIRGEIFATLDSSDFYSDAHKYIYEAIKELANEGVSLDENSISLLSGKLREHKTLDISGGHIYLVQLEQACLSTSAAKDYAKSIKKCAASRAIVNIGQALINKGCDAGSDPDKLIALAEEQLAKVGQKAQKSRLVTASEAVPDILANIVDAYDAQSRNEYTKNDGLMTGIRNLDRILQGIEPTDLCIIAARPSIGKSALALNIIQHVAVDQGKPCALFSMEMSTSQEIYRALGSAANVQYSRIKKGLLKEHEFERVKQCAAGLMDAPIWFEDSSTLTPATLRAQCRRIKQRNPELALIVIDYLQLMEGGRKREYNRQQEVAEIARTCKITAMELKTPIIGLSQMSRDIEKRGSKGARPVLADLRESGELEQSANQVIFVHREKNEKKSMLPTPTELIVAKNRNGALGVAYTTFLPSYTLFIDSNPIEETT